jgi:hypothetical protein
MVTCIDLVSDPFVYLPLFYSRLINDQDATQMSVQNPSIQIMSNATVLFIFPVTNVFTARTRVTCRIQLFNSESIDRHAWLTIDSYDNADELVHTIDTQCELVKPLTSVYFVRLGSSFSIQCQAKANNASIVWHRNGALVRGHGDDHMQILLDYMLFIDTIDVTHNGTYSCTVQTTAKCKQTSQWTLHVFDSTRHVSNAYPSNLLNFVGTHGVVLPGSSPWHVTISYRDVSDNFHYDAFCSGLLLDEETIVSVSQCFDRSSSLRTFLNQQQLQFDATKLIVYVAKYDRLSPSSFERQSSVSQLITSTNDFIVLKVHLLYLTAESRPLPLPIMNDMSLLMDNVSLFATGWGPLSTNVDKSMRLKYVQQRWTQCNGSASPLIMCTTAVAAKQPTLCPGDAGGILFAQMPHRVFAVGLVVRFSRAFCDMRSAQVTSIARLDTIFNWLKVNMLM